MKVIRSFQIPNQYIVELSQNQCSPHLYGVRYGSELSEGLTYEAAAQELGLSLMHAMACEGLIKTEAEPVRF